MMMPTLPGAAFQMIQSHFHLGLGEQDLESNLNAM